MEYEAAIKPGGVASRLAGSNSLETLTNTAIYILEQLE
jgi:hypothetical protein